jgi:hypothetical protein
LKTKEKKAFLGVFGSNFCETQSRGRNVGETQHHIT